MFRSLRSHSKDMVVAAIFAVILASIADSIEMPVAVKVLCGAFFVFLGLAGLLRFIGLMVSWRNQKATRRFPYE